MLATLSACSDNGPGRCTPPPTYKSLTMTMRPQEKDNWCWAASGEMVMEYLDASIRQCDEANKRFNREDCCGRSVPDECDQGGWPEFNEYGFDFDKTNDQALSWANVKKQIGCKETPFCATWKVEGTDEGHMVVISGYKIDNNGVKHVRIRNPLPVGQGFSNWFTYDYYVSHGAYVHWDDYYNIKKE